MDQRILNVELRSKTGKGISRQLRRSESIPGVVYGKGIESVSVSLKTKELSNAIAGEGGRNHILTLKGGGSLDGQMVIVADLLQDSLKGLPLHVDLHKINLADKIKVKVKVNLVGTAAGVKEGGLLDFAMHEIEIECLPSHIPEHLDVDVTSLTLGHSIHIGDLKELPGIKVLGDPKASIISVLGRAKEEAAPVAEA
ncbi:ribosomal protein L25 [Geotalea daltonii FRC-32]|uniref:Large ribosomal subunit protein bL25 n=1 Tax=Geotalea daltonii (strain DSM 22248 / JCM 15807 / FRC-32) TaxID=316067 RepID=RL25_GEODF|nr:50S ribosomal protein L25 [Geotalea daltonii]B9M5U4.1 RecName: Full=Large ribosomal subunit protein bL25; AltName: Full=50S ribosomal protein L25; AltName: Full=General stress protein CTC [Geotalea daltonii FRC-32]ACM19925.1 ribosomal protein L25 [Geotalea daltonii FRC-32]